MTYKIALVCALTFGASSLKAGTFGSSFGCEGAAGSVIFTDTLYGAGVSALLSGLYVWSRSDDKGFNREHAFANGLLLGSTLGFGLGITEIATRECSGGGERRRADVQHDQEPSKTVVWKLSYAMRPVGDRQELSPLAQFDLRF